jgi:hypothetical protein
MTTNSSGRTRFGPWEWLAFSLLLITTGGGLISGVVNGVRFVDRAEANSVIIEHNRKRIGIHEKRIYKLEEVSGVPHPPDDQNE